MYYEGSDVDVELYVEVICCIVEEFGVVFGEMFDFDYGSYVFFVDYLFWVNGDGMEYCNLMVLMSLSSLCNNFIGLLGIVVYEFVYVWSIE